MAGKKIGLIAGAGLGAAAAAALRRRWSGRDPGVSDDEAVTAAGSRFLERLAAAVRIPTVSYEERDRVDREALDQMHRFLARSYPMLHERLSREVVAGHSLLYTWTGSDASAAPIVLMAHLDVVPIEPETEGDWPYPPFSGEIADGYLWGRGSFDDKAAVIALCEAVEGLLDEGFRPTATVYLAFGHDEEIGGREGAAALAAVLEERGVRPEFVLDEGGAVVQDLLPGVTSPVALVGIGEKGYLDVELVATGEGGHSSRPPRRSAIGRLARAVDRLERKPVPARLETQRQFFRALAPVLPRPLRLALRNLDAFRTLIGRRLSAEPHTNALIRTTTAVTIIEGGHKPNVLPQQARAVVNFRIMPGDGTLGILEHVRRVVGPEVAVRPLESGFTAEPSRLSGTDSATYGLVAASVREVFGDIPVVPWILMAATDSRHFAGVADDVYRFAPLRATPDDMTRIHGTGERVRVADADGAVRFYRHLIRGSAGGDS